MSLEEAAPGGAPRVSQTRPPVNVSEAARRVRGAIEDLLQLLGWRDERALSLALDRVIQLEEGEP